MLEIGDTLFAVLVLTADDPDAHSGTDQLEEPPGRHHLDRRHTKSEPRLAHAGRPVRTCRQAIATPVADLRADRAATRTAAAALNPSTSAPGRAKAPLRHAATHTPQPVAATAVDNDPTGRATAMPLRAGQCARCARH